MYNTLIKSDAVSEFKILNPTDRVIVYIFRSSYVIVFDQIPDKTGWRCSCVALRIHKHTNGRGAVTAMETDCNAAYR